jgi:hypothetical protein
MPKTKDRIEEGPIYGVPLIDSLPLGEGAMLQAMPTRRDLERVAEMSQRTVAGYEVLLAHYRESQSQNERLTRANAVLRGRLADIASDSAFQPALHAATGISEADEILTEV